jgi:hypothetical protein
MNTLETYLQAFGKLNRSSGNMWPDVPLKKAPHKPFFPLALLDFTAKY